MLLYQVSITLVLVAFVALVIRNLRDYARPSATVPVAKPFVSICLPARNEAANIEPCLRGLMTQAYGQFEIVVLDDGSEDGTGDIVRRLAAADGRIRLIDGEPLRAGWAGKVHACAQLARAARGEYLLFLDADTRAHPDLLGASLAVAEVSGADMVSTFPRQITGTLPERIVLPMLTFLITALLPVRQVWESRSPALVAACGQFELFRREAYEAIGGHAAIPGSFHDGLQLVRRIKVHGGTVRLFDGSSLIVCRMYAGGRAVWDGFTRNAYEGLGSFPALVGMTGALGALFLGPFVCLAVGLYMGAPWAAWCAGQVALVLLIRALQSARFGHWESVLLTPLSVAALIAIQWGSFFRAKRGAHVEWKGRRYAGMPASR